MEAIIMWSLCLPCIVVPADGRTRVPIPVVLYPNSVMLRSAMLTGMAACV